MPKTHRVDKDVREFCGWPKLMEILSRASPGRDRALIATIFLTGGRISEVLLLRRSSFNLSEPTVIVVKSMRVLKRFRKVGEKIVEGKKRWITEELEDYRSFPISRKEPPVPILEEWLGGLKGEEKLFDISRVKAFQIVRGLGKELYPHWFRAQRACQLAVDYGFDLHELMDYFYWKDIKIAMHYSKLGWRGLAKKMVARV